VRNLLTRQNHHLRSDTQRHLSTRTCNTQSTSSSCYSHYCCYHYRH
jgi:hypothetical protein